MTQFQTPQEKAKAKRLWKAYRWTWAMYQALGAKQDWKCGICGRIATGGHSTLNLDHQHFKVETKKIVDPGILLSDPRKMTVWHASVSEFNVCVSASTKTKAIQMAKDEALPKSVRGLLCPGRHGKAGHGCCNRLLGRVDNPDWLEKARNYLLNPPAKGLDISPKV